MEIGRNLHSIRVLSVHLERVDKFTSAPRSQGCLDALKGLWSQYKRRHGLGS